MDFLSFFAVLFASPLVVVVIVVMGGWIFYSKTVGAKNHRQKKQAGLKDLRKRGITAPATVISAKNGIVNSSSGERLMYMTLEVEVQPEGRSKFVTTFKDWLPVGRHFVSWGDRPEEVGKKIWVTYNPDDVVEMLFEHHDKDRKYYLGYPAFAKLEKQNIVIRKTGEEATATILEVEDLELVHSYHKEMKSVLRLKLEVAPKSGELFHAEAQNTFMNAGLHKYTVGKKVTVKFNPQDKTQVALV